MALQSQAPCRAPVAIREADVIIAGGGPIGSVAATLLHQRGVRAILIERDNDFLTFNTSHAYALGLFPRAFALLSTIPGMLQFLKPWQSPAAHVRKLDADGKLVTLGGWVSAGSIEIFMRYRVTHLFKVFMCEHTDTYAHYGAEVDAISYLPSGEMDVRVRKRNHDGALEELTFRTRLILACDGRNSTVVRSLRNADGKSNLVHSTNGFVQHERVSPSVGLGIRTVLIQHDAAFAKFGMNESSFKEHITFMGFDQSRPHLKRFALGVFPTVEEDVRFMKGVLGVTVRVPCHDIWKITDVDEAYDFFEENFPQMDVRRMVLREDMEQYVNARKIFLPTISRPASLIARVGECRRDGGVIILGDAAHSFPPDTGQGVNSGFDDLAVLTHVLDAADPACTIGDLVQRYEDTRDKDTWALMRIAQVTSPYQYRQVPWRFNLAMINGLFRGALAKILPGWFHPSLSDMMPLSLPYSEILRRAEVTTRRLCVLGFVVGVSVLGLLTWALGLLP